MKNTLPPPTQILHTTKNTSGLFLHQKDGTEPVFIPDTGFLRLPQILQLLPVGRSTFWAAVKSGRFPAPIKLGPNISAWRVSDIRQLLSEISNH